MKRILFIILLCITSVSHADEPLPDPKTYQVWSENKKYFAEINLEDDLTTVFRIGKNEERKELWQMYGWFRWAYLSNDGMYIGIPFWGESLIPRDYRKEQVVFRLVKEGKLIRVIRLNELIENFNNLIETASHYYWGNYRGFNNNNEFIIETVEKNHFTLNPNTGKLSKKKKTK